MTKRPKAAKHVKGDNRAHSEVVEITAGTIDDEVPNDLPVQTREGSRLRVSTDSEVNVDATTRKARGRM